MAGLKTADLKTTDLKTIVYKADDLLIGFFMCCCQRKDMLSQKTPGGWVVQVNQRGMASRSLLIGQFVVVCISKQFRWSFRVAINKMLLCVRRVSFSGYN